VVSIKKETKIQMYTVDRTCLNAISPPQIPHELPWNPTRIVAMRSRRLIARGVALCLCCCYRLLRTCLQVSWCSPLRISRPFLPFLTVRKQPSHTSLLLGTVGVVSPCRLLATAGSLFHRKHKNTPCTCYIHEIVTYKHNVHWFALSNLK